jgi:hypothetical protein
LETASKSEKSAICLVVFYINTIIVNRTGLGLSFARCRPVDAVEADKEDWNEDLRLEIEAASSFSAPKKDIGKSILKVGRDWIIKQDSEFELNNWTSSDPDVVMLHMPEGGWRPCVQMLGREGEWKPLRTNENTSTMRLSGQGPTGTPLETDFSYSMGVWSKRGIKPFQRTLYVTLMPKYTVCNRMGLPMQVCSGKDYKEYESMGKVYAQISDGCSFSTLGIFRQAPVRQKSLFHSIWTSQVTPENKERQEKAKLSVRLLEDDGQPKTKFSEPFTVDYETTVALRLLHPSSDLRESLEKAAHVLVSVKEHEAANFVEIKNVQDIPPMYTIQNSTESYRIKIWQSESYLAEKGAILVEPGTTVPFSLDNADGGAKFSLSIFDHIAATTVNLMHPIQSGYVQDLKTIKYMTTVVGYTQRLKILDVHTESGLRDHKQTPTPVNKRLDEEKRVGLKTWLEHQKCGPPKTGIWPTESKAEQKGEDLRMHATLKLAGVGFSLVALNREELMYASICDFRMSRSFSRSTAETTLQIKKLQIDNQTLSGPQVAFVAGTKPSNTKADSLFFLDCGWQRNLEVTCMPYYKLVRVSIAPFVMQIHEKWMQQLLYFELNALAEPDFSVSDYPDAPLDASSGGSFGSLALLGKTHEQEQALQQLSFLAQNVRVQQQVSVFVLFY